MKYITYIVTTTIQYITNTKNIQYIISITKIVKTTIQFINFFLKLKYYASQKM